MSDTMVTEEVLAPRCEAWGKDFKNLNGLNGHNRIKHPDVDRVPEASTEPKALQPFPFTEGGVNENAAIRMVRMVIPLCPADSNPEILRRDGSSIPNPRYTGEPNCQQVYKFNNMGRWDVSQ